MSKTETGQESSNLMIQSFIIHEARAPSNHVFDNTLVQLMQDVRHNGKMDVTEGKSLQERVMDATRDQVLLAKLLKLGL